MISKEDVDHVALLSRLILTDDEREVFTSQLNDVLGHMRLLEQLDTEGVLPTTHVVPLRNVYRGDQVGKHLSRDEALSNGPNHDDNHFVVPKIL
ncbi:MAG: Asp-tRNA(Asn)/Glu-tRNA(Gln) amidotransferase subunit GatC [Peptococcaceae bacterium]|nr:Asp-tRNA(Asn)/Glu-tRNA(Gln) amidotransferase subunit GatC [Peptococcaceae bacterium]